MQMGREGGGLVAEVLPLSQSLLYSVATDARPRQVNTAPGPALKRPRCSWNLETLQALTQRDPRPQALGT